MSDSIWPRLEAERIAAADYLEAIAPPDWDRPSLCDGWRIKDVAAHLVSGAKSTPRRFVGGLIGSGFNFDKMMAKGVQREGDRTPAELVAELRRVAPKHTQPGKAMLGEAVLHQEDIRRALGEPGSYPAEDLVTVAEYYKNAGAPLRVKGRIAGLRLEATDVAWSTGDGPTVTGPAVSLLLAMTGRRAGLADLSGPGVSELDGRL